MNVPVDGLEVDEGVPVVVVDDDMVGCSQIDAEASRPRGDEVHEVAGVVVVEVPDVQLPHKLVSRAVQSAASNTRRRADAKL